ncbi:CDP-diacylglycerol--glycerol-3-phosphate 3-phosphatidyltransferase [Cellulomonas sp. JH27-2]|uniref:CDP-diacylglycerol--glycerol-3-phosphate 3-phosphatidyltransferase n=1 Tax=Cellulomonas sp. JH27-2 TaxID=2774139 RepID=UPI0017849774|nr:CDP-diacylglycerol--glycerol-3-phosphate 3-phosphatidyltransferase [Cellulomonas sp. JH27-2]
MPVVPSESPSPWNAANVLTMLRIALVPFFAWAMLADGGHTTTWRLVAAGLFALAAVTDRVDGWLARRNDQITDLGKLMDPIADKLLMGTALILLSALGDLWWWVTVVILVREIGITVLRMFLLRYVVLPASRGGKVKTVVQSFAIGLYILPLDAMPSWVSVLAAVVMAAALVLTVATGIDYLLAARRIRRAATIPPGI